jgi:AmiR/NasT family two-component response regulator
MTNAQTDQYDGARITGAPGLEDEHGTSPWTSASYLHDELQAAELRIENLEAALVNARKIGAAVGVIMGTAKVTYDQAFRMLSLASQQANEKLRVVAERVLLTGSTAQWP